MPGVAEPRSASSTLPILLPCSLILALALAPPETRGESAAGCAALILLLALLASATRPAPVLSKALLLLAALSWPIILVSAAPGKAIGPMAVWVLALAAGFGAARLDCVPTSEGLGQATTRTVVYSSLAILFMDFILTALMFSK